jgi:lysophospholipase L1-like esterase
MTTGRVPADHHPPRFLPSKTSTAGGTNVNGNQAYGYLVQLQPDAASAHPGSGLAGKWTYFRAGAGVYLEVIAATHEQSGEVLVRAKPNDVPSANYFVPITGTFVTSMGLRDEEPGIRVERVGPLPMGGRRYMQAEIAGNDPGRLTDVVAARYVSAVDGRGMVLTPIAEGGYTSASLLRHHSGCGPVLRAMGADAVMISYGANDAGQGFTPEQYKANLEVLIGWLREWISPTLPVILLTDGPHSMVPPLGAEYLARYAGANHQIALEDPLVCAVNSRALLQRAGWTNETNTTFSPDGVHYNSKGSRLKARLEASILFEHFAPRREWSHEVPGCVCLADFDCDGFVDLFDVIAFVGCFEIGECSGGRAADIDGDGFVDYFDWSAFMDHFEAGCP